MVGWPVEARLMKAGYPSLYSELVIDVFCVSAACECLLILVTDVTYRIGSTAPRIVNKEVLMLSQLPAEAACWLIGPASLTKWEAVTATLALSIND